jgi:hypothetical protein
MIPIKKSGKARAQALSIYMSPCFYPFKIFLESSVKRYVRKFNLMFYRLVPDFLIINKGNVVIQVGTANTATMKRFSKYARSKGRVYIIEADPDNSRKLSDEIEKLNLINITPVPFAAWSEKLK